MAKRKFSHYGFTNSNKVWTSWDECAAETKGVSGTPRGFYSYEEALGYSKVIIKEEYKVIKAQRELPKVILTEMQELAVRNVVAWYHSDHIQEFVLAGYAGTGKSFLVQYIIAALNLDLDQVAFATFTGKAALVVTRKADGKYSCQTLHSTLYNAEEQSDGSYIFVKRDKRDFRHIKLFVIDEASMVSAELLTDLMSLGIKVLFVGDHGQLQPVGEISWVYDRLKNSPDFALTEIHRQAADNPIIKIATMARMGQQIPLGNYDGKVLVIDKKELTKYDKSLLNADQVICGLNNTRHSLNNRIREMKGISNPGPINGEKLICLRNNKKQFVDRYQLVNGMIGTATNISTRGKVVEFDFKPDFTEAQARLKALKEEIMGNDVLHEERKRFDAESFNFGYAITTHKSQGSQWKKVFMISETFRSCEANEHGYNPEMLYTGITRAEELAIIAINQNNIGKWYAGYSGVKAKSGSMSL